MKGKIIWILYENCLYCSEIREFCVGSPSQERISIYLNPIIGVITQIIMERGQYLDSIAHGWIYFGDEYIGHSGKFSINFDRICLLIN